MVYHVRITKKSDPGRDSLELDLSKKELMDNILNPYHSNQKFHCGGDIIDPNDIRTIKINYTKKKSDYYLPIIRTRRQRSNAIALTISDEWYVTEEGKVVTRKFLKYPPKNIVRRSRKKLRTKKKTKYSKIDWKKIKTIVGIIVPIIGLFGYGATHYIKSNGNNNTNIIDSGDINVNVSGENNQVNVGDTYIYGTEDETIGTDKKNEEQISEGYYDCIYKNARIYRGETGRLGFSNEKFVLGLLGIEYSAECNCDKAHINFNLDDNFQEAYAGNISTFEIGNKEYDLVISEVNLIQDYIRFDICQK